jgi:Na+/H+-translocating membrane pyrophosphatase
MGMLAMDTFDTPSAARLWLPSYYSLRTWRRSQPIANRSLTSSNLANIEVFIGGLLGAMLAFLFSALSIRAVGRTAFYVSNEVQRQFRENAGIMRGELNPDFARCVDIVTAGALREIAMPSLLAVGNRSQSASSCGQKRLLPC